MEVSSHQFQYSGLPSQLIAAYFFHGTPDIRFRVPRIITSSTELRSISEEMAEESQATLQPFKQSEEYPQKISRINSGYVFICLI